MIKRAKHKANYTSEKIIILMNQGLAVLGHCSVEENLCQIIKCWTEDIPKFQQQLESGEYQSPEIVNEQIQLHFVLDDTHAIQWWNTECKCKRTATTLLNTILHSSFSVRQGRLSKLQQLMLFWNYLVLFQELETIHKESQRESASKAAGLLTWRKII